jgi:hypothetical protein
MIRLFALLLSFLASTAVQAQLTPQQERMKTCNATAGERELKGDERKEFMSGCLRGETQLTAQQEKMKTCNREAGEKSLEGDKRRAFMSECLSADSGQRKSAAGGSARGEARR